MSYKRNDVRTQNPHCIIIWIYYSFLSGLKFALPVYAKDVLFFKSVMFWNWWNIKKFLNDHNRYTKIWLKFKISLSFWPQWMSSEYQFEANISKLSKEINVNRKNEWSTFQFCWPYNVISTNPCCFELETGFSDSHTYAHTDVCEDDNT